MVLSKLCITDLSVEKILSETCLQEIAEVVDKAEPYEGAVEFLEAVKTRNYDIYVITDNPLAGFTEVKEILKQKFPVEDIYTTSKFNQETLELSGYTPKQEIFTILYYNYRPEILLGIVQGKNDIALAYEIKKYKGMLIVANSNSRDLKKIADYSVKNTSYLPELVDKIP